MNHKLPKNISPNDLFKWLQKESTKPILIDVREDNELDLAKFPEKNLHLPLSKFDTWVHTLHQYLSIEKPIVVLCHSGIRSWNFGTWLIEQNSRYDVWNLAGGIDAWSQEIDNSVPRY
tara:strand:+ start:951 stop:1304 length:354 start_codon:yes stop_codon:yes gene_type:complete